MKKNVSRHSGEKRLSGYKTAADHHNGISALDILGNIPNIINEEIENGGGF